MARGIIGPGFDEYVQKQINLRQKNNRAYTNGDLKSRDILKYQGADTAFLRLTSGVNVNGSSDQAKQFQLFNTQFGVKQDNGAYDYQIAAGVKLGQYNSAYGFLSNSSYGYVPPPGLISADIKSLNRGSLREATIQMKCHSADQLEVINNLYLRLGFSMLLEWGWSFYFDNNGNYQTNYHNLATDTYFFNEKATQDYILAAIQIDREKSCGNYDAMYGVVKNYSWSLEKDGSYDITLNLVSVGDVIESLKMNKSNPSSISNPGTSTAPTEDQPPLQYNKDKSNLNRILYSLTEQIPPDGFSSGNWYLNNDKTTTAVIDSKTGLKSNQINNASSNIQGEVIGTYFPELKGVASTTGYNAQYYMKLGFLLRIMQNYSLLYDTTKPSSSSLFSIDFDYDSNYMFTFPRHCSLDPRVALIPIDQDVKSNSSSSSYSQQITEYQWNTIVINWPDKGYTSNEITVINNQVHDYSSWFSVPIKDMFNSFTTGAELDMGLFQAPFVLNSNNLLSIPISQVTEVTSTSPLTSLDNYYIIESNSSKSPQDIQNQLNNNKSGVDSFINDYIVEWNDSYESSTNAGADFGSPNGKNITAQENTLYLLDTGVEKGKYINKKTVRITGVFKSLVAGIGTISETPTYIDVDIYTRSAKFVTIVNQNQNYNNQNNPSPSNKDIQNNLYEIIRPGSNFRIPNYEFIGKLLSIYINMDYIAKTLDGYVDVNTGAIAIYDFLDKLMSGVQNALGNVNNFSVTYDETTNKFGILDSTFIPGLADFKPEIFKNKPVEFITHTLEPNKGSFVRDASVKTQLSNNFATMVTVGAQANGNVVGENATALSKWNVGLTDRIIKEKTTANEPTDPKDIEASYTSNIAILNQLQSRINDGNITDEQIDGAKNAGVDLFKYEIGTFTNDSTIPGIGFLPINLELTMDGLSGMRIYESYTADTRLLPKNYKDAIQFIIKGISHKIQKDDWTTTIESISGPRFDGVKTGKSKPITFNLQAGKPTTSNDDITIIKDKVDCGKVPDSNYARNNKIGSDGVRSSNSEVKLRLSKGINNGSTQDLIEVKSKGNVKVKVSGDKALLTQKAADAFNKWVNEINSQGGCMTITSIFRTFEDQKRVKAQKVAEGRGDSAAEPGTSPHGWGVAIDISELYGLVNGDSSPEANKAARNTKIYKFLASTGEKYGWYNPWRLADGVKTDECWHFEYWG